MKNLKNSIFVIGFLATVILACSVINSVPDGISGVLRINEYPLFVGRENKSMLGLDINVSAADKNFNFHYVDLVFKNDGNPGILKSVKFNHIVFSSIDGSRKAQFVGEGRPSGGTLRINVGKPLPEGNHRFSFDFMLNDNVLLEQSFAIEEVRISLGRNRLLVKKPDKDFRFRPAVVLREAGQDNVHTYRIPGIITTTKGTLIAVYDIRHNSSKDLQEDIDVGMSRSTDGGQSWEPMRIIMDKGEWGGRSERHNGVGDPAVLYDHTTGTIWVAALWMSGSSPDKMLWWDSKPGMLPEETGQFLLTKSTDDGLTWSEIINITPQIKNPEWQLLLAGPGGGITLIDGTLVFAGQFKKDIGVQALDGGQYTSHSTIVYSKDGGNTWQIGTGAKPNTTEAQVVQLPDGSLMLNMRDDKNRRDKGENNGRAVAITRDMGQTWQMHVTTNSALPEPNCMASLISHKMNFNGQTKQVLFFSNPNDKFQRINMTIKASFDNGMTWPRANQVLLNRALGFGYSCLTMVDDKTIGIVYEGTRNLFFQKVPVSEFLR